MFCYKGVDGCVRGDLTKSQFWTLQCAQIMAKNDFCDKYFEYYLQVNDVGRMNENITIEY